MDLLQHLRAPPVTTALMAVSVFCTFLVTFDVVDPLQMVFSPTLVAEHGEYWRVLTSLFFYGRFSIHSLLYLNWVFTVSKSLEDTYYSGRPLDYLLTLLAGDAMLMVLRYAGIVHAAIMTMLFDGVRVYLFSRLIPEQRINVGFLTIPARAIPWMFVILSTSFQGFDSVRDQMVAIAVGHVLFYLLEVFPRIVGFSPFQVQRHVNRFLGLQEPQGHIH